MKLLLVVNVDWFFLSHRLPIALAARQRGFDVHIATTITSPALRKKLIDFGFTLHELFIDRSGSNVFLLANNFCSLFLLFLRVKPDILHLVTIQPVLLGGIAARLSNVPNVVYAISGLGHSFVASSWASKFRKHIILCLYRFSLTAPHRAVIFQNSADKLLLSQVCSLHEHECHLIPGSGVDISLFRYTPPPSGIPTVLMAARLLSTKGVREFVQAAHLLYRNNFIVRFQLVGSPDFSNPAAITQVELTQWRKDSLVEILGFRTDLHDLMTKAHIICHPSYYPEGLPKVLCEAAAAGRPVITTNLPGCSDAIIEGVTGLLIDPRDSQQLADAIRFLCTNKPLLHQMSTSSRIHAEQLFDINDIVSKHLYIYKSLLKSSVHL